MTGLTDPATASETYLARITGVEVVSAVMRRHRAGHLPASDAGSVLSDFRFDFDNQYLLIEVTGSLIDRSMVLAESRALRGYGAVQPAAALQVAAQCDPLGLSFTLVSADGDLNAAASAEGLVVEDPNTHANS